MKNNFILNLYERMKENPNLAGSYKLVNEIGIEWDLFESFTIHIGQDYFGIDGFLFNKIPNQLTHWHPDDDEMYETICAIGTRGNVTVIKKSWLGVAILYMGPVSDCPYSRKWLFGKYLYLYAK